MPGSLGGSTKTIFFKGLSGDTLHEEFIAASAIEEGQLVKLVAANGRVEPIAAGDPATLIIGVAKNKAGSLANVTVCMRGIGTIMAEGSASMSAGPVKFASFTSGTGYNRFQAAPSTTGFVAASSGGSPTVSQVIPDPAQCGWALVGSTNAGDVIRVVIRN